MEYLNSETKARSTEDVKRACGLDKEGSYLLGEKTKTNDDVFRRALQHLQQKRCIECLSGDQWYVRHGYDQVRIRPHHFSSYG